MTTGKPKQQSGPAFSQAPPSKSAAQDISQEVAGIDRVSKESRRRSPKKKKKPLLGDPGSLPSILGE